MSKAEDKASLPEPGLASSKREFIETFFKRGAEFTEELMRENEKLRFRVVQLEEERRLAANATARGDVAGGGALRELVARIESLEAERDQLLSRFSGVERENRAFFDRYQEFEREHNNLANLYVTTYQLHSTLDMGELTQTILEILLNFVGAKTFAIQLIDEDQRRLVTLAAEGIARERVPLLRSDGGRVGEAFASGTTYIDGERLRARADLERPVIVVPLKIRERVVGGIVIWDLLAQKTALADVDYELFNLLAAHAASALLSAWLLSQRQGQAVRLWSAAGLV